MLQDIELNRSFYLISIKRNPAITPTFFLCVVRTQRSSDANKNLVS